MRPIQEAPLPLRPDTTYAKDLNFALKGILRIIAQRLNALSDGQISAVDNAATAAPTTGTYARGDFIRHSQPVEAGLSGGMFVVTGFICVTGGTPGTWRSLRSLTGN